MSTCGKCERFLNNLPCDCIKPVPQEEKDEAYDHIWSMGKERLKEAGIEWRNKSNREIIEIGLR